MKIDPLKSEPETQQMVRLPVSLKRRIEAHLDRMRILLPGTKPSMNEACINLLLTGLDQAEKTILPPDPPLKAA